VSPSYVILFNALSDVGAKSEGGEPGDAARHPRGVRAQLSVIDDFKDPGRSYQDRLDGVEYRILQTLGQEPSGDSDVPCERLASLPYFISLAARLEVSQRRPPMAWTSA
jgi:hypothetical protein